MGKLQDIVIIGPVYPYKGGISHYTTLLYNALKNKYNTKLISYKLQYPRFLFKKEQKDYTDKIFEVKEAKFWINTINPINCIISAFKIKKMNPDLVIFQWWHPYFAPCYWIIEKVLGKKIKKLFLCHNVLPHERFPLDKFLTKKVLKQGDLFITQSNLDSNDLISIENEAIYKQTFHPTYNAFKINQISYEDSRKLLGIKENEKIILFFGFVRKYKGLKYLIEAMPKVIENIKNIKLYIVGEFENNKEEYMNLISELEIESHIKIVDSYIPNDEVEKYFMSSDLVVLPYESATQSGIVQIAYNFEKPVIVTNVGGLPEVVEDNKTGYVVESKNNEKLAEYIIRYFKEDKKAEFEENIKKSSYKFSWERMVNVIEELFKEI